MGNPQDGDRHINPNERLSSGDKINRTKDMAQREKLLNENQAKSTNTPKKFKRDNVSIKQNAQTSTTATESSLDKVFFKIIHYLKKFIHNMRCEHQNYKKLDRRVQRIATLVFIILIIISIATIIIDLCSVIHLPAFLHTPVRMMFAAATLGIAFLIVVASLRKEDYESKMESEVQSPNKSRSTPETEHSSTTKLNILFLKRNIIYISFIAILLAQTSVMLNDKLAEQPAERPEIIGEKYEISSKGANTENRPQNIREQIEFSNRDTGEMHFADSSASRTIHPLTYISNEHLAQNPTDFYYVLLDDVCPVSYFEDIWRTSDTDELCVMILSTDSTPTNPCTLENQRILDFSKLDKKAIIALSLRQGKDSLYASLMEVPMSENGELSSVENVKKLGLESVSKNMRLNNRSVELRPSRSGDI